MSTPVEISWFGALCDDDYEFLGVPNPELQSSWNHCCDIVQTADRNGFDNILLPSGYQLGIDSTVCLGDRHPHRTDQPAARRADRGDVARSWLASSPPSTRWPRGA